MNVIVHIAAYDAWQKAVELGSYQAPSLLSDGFIHCSTPEQVIHVANTFYRGQTNLVLLIIDPRALQSQLKFEGPINPHTGEPEKDKTHQFPHIYGSINIEAVIKVMDFYPLTDGTFELPEF